MFHRGVPCRRTPCRTRSWLCTPVGVTVIKRLQVGDLVDDIQELDDKGEISPDELASLDEIVRLYGSHVKSRFGSEPRVRVRWRPSQRFSASCAARFRVKPRWLTATGDSPRSAMSNEKKSRGEHSTCFIGLTCWRPSFAIRGGEPSRSG